MDIPKVLASRFAIQDKLHERPNCYIYTALDRELGDRKIAVKLFVDHPNDNAVLVELFSSEVTKLKAVSHQTLVPIIAGGLEQNWLYIAMELIEGPTLRDVLRDEAGALEFDRALHIIQSLGEGVNELHQEGVVHGHIDARAILFKGQNVRLAGYTPRAIDKLQQGMTTGGRLTVDPAYIAPEQITSPDDYDARADIYALSALFFEMITGTKPFNAGNPLQTSMLRLSQEPPSPAKLRSGISPLIDAAVLKGLSRDRDRRFKSVDEMLDAFTGGKSPQKNPFVGAAGEFAERLSTETIAVSMSADQLRQMLATHQSGASSNPSETVTSAPRPEGHKQINGVDRALKAEPDIQGTAIGIEPQSVLKASFVIVSGPRQGEKFLFNKPQLIIGSDSLCDVVLDGKNVPPRYAIAVQRGSEFHVGPLSPTGVVVNGDELSGGEEVLIKRGDIINVGPHGLRFVAPGEVFTLRDNVADRVVDRPQSKIHKVVIVLIVLLLLISGGGVYMYNEAVQKQKSIAKQKETDKARRRDAAVNSLLQEGDEFFKNGALIEPVDANARARFQAVLELNPDHSYAKRRLAEIAERISTLEEDAARKKQFEAKIVQLLADGERYFKAGDYTYPPGKNAREVYQEVLHLDARNEIARAQIAEIDRLVGDQLSRLETLLARAQVYIDLGQFIDPAGENASEILKRVLKLDPGNELAQNALLDMAAYVVFEGDRAKAAAKVATMKKSYLTAQVLGVDPAYLDPRLAGAKLMEQSKASVIIYDRKEEEKAVAASSKDKGYLDTQEIERRVAALSLRMQNDPNSDGRIFINLDSRSKH